MLLDKKKYQSSNYIDNSKFISNYGDNIHLFKTELVKEITDLSVKIANENEDNKKIFLYLHSLKGVAASFYLSNLFNLLSDITPLVKNGNIDSSCSWRDILDNILQNTLEEIKKLS